MRSAVVLMLAACGANVSAVAPACTGGDAHALAPDGKCLEWFAGPAMWTDARTACEAAGGELASIPSAAVDGVAEPLCGTTDTFTGGNDRGIEGTFVWLDGQPFTYTNWEAGEPSNGGGQYEEDCLVIAASRAAKGWDDRPCDASQVPNAGSYAYLCEL